MCVCVCDCVWSDVYVRCDCVIGVPEGVVLRLCSSLVDPGGVRGRGTGSHLHIPV